MSDFLNKDAIHLRSGIGAISGETREYPEKEKSECSQNTTQVGEGVKKSTNSQRQS
ncbi:MAG TPA: hypothetical protein VK666_18350 [Chryseolinea sp.]|nr:hypothetical protein [Chryseolinea sp.]